MKITIHYKGKPLEKDLPIRWEEIPFKKFVAIHNIKGKDLVKLLSILLDLPYKDLRKAQIKNIDQVSILLNFLRRADMLPPPSKILGYPLPEDLEFQSIGRYEDACMILEGFPTDANKIKGEHLEKYAELCTIYAMPDYEDSSEKEKEQFTKRFMDAPCMEVMAVANFTFRKLIRSRRGVPKLFLSLITLPRRLRLAWLGLRTNISFTVRYWLWSARQPTRDTRSLNGQSKNLTKI